MVVLKEGEIQVRETRPDHRITAQIAPQADWIRKSQALRPNIVVGIAGIAERLAARTRQAVWRLGSLVGLRPIWIPPKIGVNG